jgi:two-component system response regulator NreC
MSLRILIVDDHVLVRAGFSYLLNNEPDLQVVGEASSGEEAVRLAAELRPDIVLMDISMPGCDGIATTRQIKEEWPTIHVLILTFHDDRHLVREALEAGASGFVLKRASVSDLFSAIHTIMYGGFYLDPAIMRPWMHDLPAKPDRSTQAEHSLTQRQIQVLQLVAQGYTTPQIAEHLVISARTVEYHRRSLADKLHLQNRAELVHFAVEHGLLAHQDT